MTQAKPATAKLFMHGRSQAVRLPKEFRFEGTEVFVWRDGGRVVLEPMQKPPFDVAAWRAKLDGFLNDEFPDVDRDPSRPSEDIRFD
ncbi:AbrB/MazE/SpoVT family DNA-binding domain-containing protein [uncultured Alsobacter sp.]|uniref:antitoxin n=1 Tax=uncultured Alsobacter sp. TaxID=1748258 RepID=UPI0025FD5555|nr:AbrB/MazE/SpoVT family DNA-binding domain-containing protein [uncultured Alsobacter sp.]